MPLVGYRVRVRRINAGAPGSVPTITLNQALLAHAEYPNGPLGKLSRGAQKVEFIIPVQDHATSVGCLKHMCSYLRSMAYATQNKTMLQAAVDNMHADIEILLT